MSFEHLLTDAEGFVRAHVEGEPGSEDVFDIRLAQNGRVVYGTDLEGILKLNDGNGPNAGVTVTGAGTRASPWVVTFNTTEPV